MSLLLALAVLGVSSGLVGDVAVDGVLALNSLKFTRALGLLFDLGLVLALAPQFGLLHEHVVVAAAAR